MLWPLQWVDKVFKKVATDELILKGFRECGYMEYSNDILVLHSRLQDTIKGRQVPFNVVQEVNKFLEEMLEAQLEAESNDDEVVESSSDISSVETAEEVLSC